MRMRQRVYGGGAVHCGCCGEKAIWLLSHSSTHNSTAELPSTSRQRMGKVSAVFALAQKVRLTTCRVGGSYSVVAAAAVRTMRNALW